MKKISKINLHDHKVHLVNLSQNTKDFEWMFE